MRKCAAAMLVLAFALSTSAQQRAPQILEIYRDHLKPGALDAYRKIEQDAAQICARLKCPHPYLGIESLTGPKEAWWFNGFESQDELKQVVDAYGKNPPILAALEEITQRKKDLLSAEATNDFLNVKPQSCGGPPWTLGYSRFLVISWTKLSTDPGKATETKCTGTMYETETLRVIIRPVTIRRKADTVAAAAGPGSRVFAVRPDWSMPAKEWVAADPRFWKLAQAPGAH